MLAHVLLNCSSLFPTFQERFKELWLKICIVLHVQSTLIRLCISTLLRVMNKTVNSLHILCIFALNVHLLSSGKINVNIFGLHLREITPVLKGKDL